MENFLRNRAARMIIFAAIGATAGYFVGGFIADKLTQDNIEVIEPKKNIDDIEVEQLERPKNKRKQQARPHALVRDYAGITLKEKGSLDKLAAKYKTNAEAVENDLNELTDPNLIHPMNPEGETVDPDAIRVISEQEYNERPEVTKPYTKTILHYYEEDDVVTDEGDVPINHPERIIGEEALLSFGDGTTDPDLVFVLNPLTGDMYQVIRMHKNYATQEESKPRRETLHRSSRKKEEDEEP